MTFLKKTFQLFSLVFLATVIACQTSFRTIAQQDSATSQSGTFAKPQLSEIKSPTIRMILESAAGQTETTTSYSGDYYTIPYPNGDVPKETGACTDVIIRAFRASGVDLQKEIHEDMRDNFSKYPKKWGLLSPDPNIDHRRVLNLQTFFDRKGKSLPVTKMAEDYLPGDVVTWDLNGKGLTHTGLVSNIWNDKSKRYLVIHNIGSGTRLEDRIFEWEVTGHYRYF